MQTISPEDIGQLKECVECSRVAQASIDRVMDEIVQMFDLQERLRTGTDCHQAQLVLHDGDVSIDLSHLMQGGQVTVAQLTQPLAEGVMSRMPELSKQWQELQLLGMRAAKLIEQIRSPEKPTTPVRRGMAVTEG